MNESEISKYVAEINLIYKAGNATEHTTLRDILIFQKSDNYFFFRFISPSQFIDFLNKS